MNAANLDRPAVRPTLLFLKEYLREHRTQGALLPSSKYLGRRIAARVPVRDGMLVVELGAGTGAFTKMILSRMPESATLLVIESNRTLADFVRRHIQDKRLKVIADDAARMRKHLRLLSLPKADCVVSGLPLGDFPRAKRQDILVAIRESLQPQGTFLQFQYFLASLFHIKRMFDLKIVGYEIRNFPPAFVYECRKKSP